MSDQTAGSRRSFFKAASLSLLGAAAMRSYAQTQNLPANSSQQAPPGSPPAFGTGPLVGPEVSPNTFAEAQKLVQIELTDSEREVAASSWRADMASLYERRTGPRKIALESSLAPATKWDPMLPGLKMVPERDRFIRSKSEPAPPPSKDEDIAFASVSQLSHWIQQRKLTSERLTNIYLQRLEKFNPTLRCVITLTRELALKQAKQADLEIAAGKCRRSAGCET